jgi:hypothetical protein
LGSEEYNEAARPEAQLKPYWTHVMLTTASSYNYSHRLCHVFDGAVLREGAERGFCKSRFTVGELGRITVLADGGVGDDDLTGQFD